ncbi:MAG: histidine kinase [Myxococcales bacterium]|nr:histidine kinase [Myxococcales bacterium]
MRVRARLVLFGAILPSVGTLAAILIAGELFAHDLLRSVDDGLRNQAAVESVSLFDAPGGAPHLHFHESPRVEEPTLGNVIIAVYGADGAPIIRFPESAAIPARLPPDERHANPGPHTVVTPGGERRELVVNLVSRAGQHYALWLATSLDRLHATTRAFYRSTLSVCAGLALLLLAVQGWQARKLSSRIMRVSAQLPKLREGDFDSAPPPDDSGDEVTDLRAAVVDAAAELKAARERQERLIANAAHELRTPLGLMRTEIDLALRKERSPAELRDALKESRREVDRLAALAQKLLDLAALRGVALAHQPGDVAAVVAEAVEACRTDAREHEVDVQLVAPSEAPATFAATRLRQAIDNLLSNAIRFAPAGSAVSVRVERQPRQWRIAVADRGRGVADADRERIFEPFFRGRTDGTGSGLGLAIVREVAREHGGACRLEPRSDATTFVLEIADGSSA